MNAKNDYMTLRIPRSTPAATLIALAFDLRCSTHQLSDGSIAFIPLRGVPDARNEYGFPSGGVVNAKLEAKA